MAERDLSAERLREIVEYDPETGAMIWISRTSARCRVGGAVGNINGAGYRECRIDGARTYVHRVAWFIVHGVWHDGHIDHINGIKSDNRIANLRAVSASTNIQNQKRARSDNKSGLLGVAPHFGHPGRFTAQIHVRGKKKHLGCFDTAESAHAAYIEAKRTLHAGNTL
jgi:hypothetical protein